MEVLSTAFALVALAACGFLCWQAHGYSREARDAALELRKSQGKIAAHTLTLDSHHAQLRALNGKIAQMKYSAKRRDDDLDEPFHRPDMTPQGTLNGELDPDLAAELALQNAPSASPGAKG